MDWKIFKSIISPSRWQTKKAKPEAPAGPIAGAQPVTPEAESEVKLEVRPVTLAEVVPPVAPSVADSTLDAAEKLLTPMANPEVEKALENVPPVLNKIVESVAELKIEEPKAKTASPAAPAPQPLIVAEAAPASDAKEPATAKEAMPVKETPKDAPVAEKNEPAKKGDMLSDIFDQGEEEKESPLSGLMASLPDITVQELFAELQSVKLQVREEWQKSGRKKQS